MADHDHGVTLTRDDLPAKPKPEEKKNLTVIELVIALLSLPPEQQGMTVMTQGCDCFGHVVAVGTATSLGFKKLDDGEVIVLCRPDGK